MTTITTTRISTRGLVARTTSFDRALLLTASALDTFVAARVERRAGAERRRALAAQEAVASTRRSAQTLGAAGMLPR